GCPSQFILGGHPWVNLHVLFVVSSVARLGAAFLAARVNEPGAATTRTVAQVVERFLPRPATAGSRVPSPPRAPTGA
ncbi:MFS transporter, partial [Corallococcus sp. 4LFB]